MEGHEPKRRSADTATAEKLKHLADLIEQGEPISLRINGRRVALPTDARFAIDLDRDPRSGCVKVDIRWSVPPESNTAIGRKALETKRDVGRNPHIRLKALISSPTI